MTYGELPQSPSYGVALFCPEGHDEGYSASRGDYFWAPDDEVIVCGECGEPMFLGRSVVTIKRV